MTAILGRTRGVTPAKEVEVGRHAELTMCPPLGPNNPLADGTCPFDVPPLPVPGKNLRSLVRREG